MKLSSIPAKKRLPIPSPEDQPALPPPGKQRMYAVAFDLDVEILKQTYGDPYNNAYGEIKRFMQGKGFDWQQGSVYFGRPELVNAVT